MGFQLSPGVNISEYDLTGFIPAVATTGAAFVGQFQWGPVEDYTVLQNKKQLEQLFGKPNDVNYRDWFSCSNFLDYSNNLNVVRVVDSDVAINATVDGNGLLVKNETQHSQILGTANGDAAIIAAKYPGDLGDSLRVVMMDSGTWGTDVAMKSYEDLFDSAPGTSDFVEHVNGANDEVHILVIDEQGLFTGNPGATLERFEFLSKAKDATRLDGEPAFYGSVLNKKSEYVWWFENPDSTAYAEGGEVTGVTVVTAGSGYEAAPTVTVSGDGTGAVGFATLSATGELKELTIDIPGTLYATDDPIVIVGDGTGATAKVSTVGGGGEITGVEVLTGGSGYTTITSATADETTGSGATLSGVVGYEIDSVTLTGSATSASVDSVGVDYAVSDTLTMAVENAGTAAVLTVDSVDVDGGITGLSVTTAGDGYEAHLTNVSAAATSGAGTGAKVTVLVDAGGQNYVSGTTTVVIDAPASGGTQATATATVSVSADYDADWDTTANSSLFKSLSTTLIYDLSGGVNSTSITEDELLTGWAMFRNAEVVDVSLLIVGDGGENSTGVTHKTVVKYVIDNIAEWRKDCVAFFSPRHDDVVGYNEVQALENVLETRHDINNVSSYSFMDSGWKYQYDVFNDKYRWVPLNADMAGLCAVTDLARDPWWSPAGFTRGQIKNVIKLAFNPNKGARDELYKVGINPCVSFKGEGVVLYGDRTQLAKPSAFQKLNIRRLFIVLEKAIAKAAKYQLFEFNDKFTRANFVAQVEPYLRDVQGRRGIQDFRVICDETNNTPEVIDRSEFVADIYVKPAYSINFIQLNFIAVRSGVEFNEVIGIASTNV